MYQIYFTSFYVGSSPKSGSADKLVFLCYTRRPLDEADLSVPLISHACLSKKVADSLSCVYVIIS